MDVRFLQYHTPLYSALKHASLEFVVTLSSSFIHRASWCEGPRIQLQAVALY